MAHARIQELGHSSASEWVEIAISVGNPGGTSAELLHFCLDVGVYDLAGDM